VKAKELSRTYSVMLEPLDELDLAINAVMTALARAEGRAADRNVDMTITHGVSARDLKRPDASRCAILRTALADYKELGHDGSRPRGLASGLALWAIGAGLDDLAVERVGGKPGEEQLFSAHDSFVQLSVDRWKRIIQTVERGLSPKKKR